MKTSRILILDDDMAFRKMVRDALGVIFRVDEAGDETGFRAKFEPFRYELLLLDMRLRGDREGMDVLRSVYAADPLQPVIMLSRFGNADAAIEAVNAGAMMFLHKQEFTPAQLIRMAEAVVEQGRLRRQTQSLRDLAWRNHPDYLIGQSAGVQEARQRLQSLAIDWQASPLVVGEMGTGTTLLSRLLHRFSDRSSGPLVEVDANRLSPAPRFSLADLRQTDAWNKAYKGTLVVDHVVEPTDRLMNEVIDNSNGKMSPTGDDKEPRVVVIANVAGNATDKVRQRSDEWAQSRRTIYLPPLRDRREDVAVLTHHFVQEQRQLHGGRVMSVAGDAMERLEQHHWYGNVRELRNVIEFATLRLHVNEDDLIESRHLPSTLASSGSVGNDSASWDYRYQTSRAEIELVHQAIVRRGITVKTRLAEELGYSDRFTLLRRIRKAMTNYPRLAKEFPAVAEMFLGARNAGERAN
ncbi:MAG: sigma-54-dependent Fis family transcriptional regulator [Pirellulaceae bacterium]|nr:sigma-54-dependent Fis family transcriptional regulator [Pirellulaceae bacterium]